MKTLSPAGERADSPLEVPLREKDAAPFAGTTPAYLRKLRHLGRGPAFIKLGKRVAYLPSDLRAYVQAGRRNTSDASAPVNA